MVHSKQYVVEYMLSVGRHWLGQIHVLGNCAFLLSNNE